MLHFWWREAEALAGLSTDDPARNNPSTPHSAAREPPPPPDPPSPPSSHRTCRLFRWVRNCNHAGAYPRPESSPHGWALTARLTLTLSLCAGPFCVSLSGSLALWLSRWLQAAHAHTRNMSCKTSHSFFFLSFFCRPLPSAQFARWGQMDGRTPAQAGQLRGRETCTAVPLRPRLNAPFFRFVFFWASALPIDTNEANAQMQRLRKYGGWAVASRLQPPHPKRHRLCVCNNSRTGPSPTGVIDHPSKSQRRSPAHSRSMCLQKLRESSARAGRERFAALLSRIGAEGGSKRGRGITPRAESLAGVAKVGGVEGQMAHLGPNS